jgi:hypothetical protein
MKNYMVYVPQIYFPFYKFDYVIVSLMSEPILLRILGLPICHESLEQLNSLFKLGWTVCVTPWARSLQRYQLHHSKHREYVPEQAAREGKIE